LAPGGQWLFSDFNVPARQPMRLISRIMLGVLYPFFRISCGINARRLPDFSAEFANLGLAIVHERQFVGGLLVAGLYRRSAR
jgi:hypothetical protein